MGEDPAESLERELEEQLLEHKASLRELEDALTLDPHNHDLISIREELVAAMTVAEDSLLQLKHARLLQDDNGFFALEACDIQGLESNQNTAVQMSLQIQKSVFASGSKCRFRHSNGRWYNGQVIGYENDELARVSFLTPTAENMQICRYYMQQRCRFGANCRMSHGFLVAVDALKKFNPASFQGVAIGSKVLACSSRDGIGLWKHAEVESWDGVIQRGNVVFVEDGSHLEVGKDCVCLSEFAEVSDDDDTSSEDELSDVEGDASADDCIRFMTMTTSQTGPQTDTVIFANWEKHTRGMASKMMANMGYREGMGLGRVCQGITTPLQVQVLPKNRSLDFISEGSELRKGENNTSERRKSRGGKRKRDKKLAEAARAAKDEEEKHPDVFEFINNQLSGYRDNCQDSFSKKVGRGQQATTEAAPQKVDRRALLVQEDEVKDLKLKVEKLEEMAQRNRKDKAVYGAVCQKLGEAREALSKAEATHASARHTLHSKENEKKWLRF